MNLKIEKHECVWHSYLFDNVYRDAPQHNDIGIGLPKKFKEVPNFESSIEETMWAQLRTWKSFDFD
jgi:hypothetical protein